MAVVSWCGGGFVVCRKQEAGGGGFFGGSSGWSWEGLSENDAEM